MQNELFVLWKILEHFVFSDKRREPDFHIWFNDGSHLVGKPSVIISNKDYNWFLGKYINPEKVLTKINDNEYRLFIDSETPRNYRGRKENCYHG